MFSLESSCHKLNVCDALNQHQNTVLHSNLKSVTLDTGDKQPAKVNSQEELGSEVLQEQQPKEPSFSSELKGKCEHSVGTPDGTCPRKNKFEKEKIHGTPSGIFDPEKLEHQKLKDTSCKFLSHKSSNQSQTLCNNVNIGTSLRGVVSGIIPPQLSQQKHKTAVVIASSFPFWCLASQGLPIKVQYIVLQNEKWFDLVQQTWPSIKTVLISEIEESFHSQTSVDMILVNGCKSHEVSSIENYITSQNVLFDSRIRGKYKSLVRYEGKQSHWLVGGSTDSVFKYTLFYTSDIFKHSWLNFKARQQPHTDVLLHINSATGISKEHTKQFACKGFSQFTTKEYQHPMVVSISKNVYHPSGLYPHLTPKPKFILPCVFSPTGFVKRPPNLLEQCSMWDIPHGFLKLLSKLQSIEFWNILTNPIKLLQYALLQNIMVVFGPGGGE